MDPEVSVIIATKNRAQYLLPAIQSVLDQTFEDFELIVVDGASTDNTREVINKLEDKRIHYIHEKKDRGVSATRNTGIKHSAGRFIAFLDDDDLWMPTKLEKQVNLINKNPRIGAVSTGAWIINNSGKIIGFRIPSLRGNIFPKILMKNNVGNCSMVLVRKESLRKAGLFDESLPAGEDFDLFIRLAKHYEFECVKECLIFYRVHEKSITADPYKCLKAEKLLYRKYSKEFASSCDQRKILGFWHYRLGMLYCQSRDISQGRKEFLKAITSYPFHFLCYVRLFASFLGLKVFDKITRLEFFLPDIIVKQVSNAQI